MDYGAFLNFFSVNKRTAHVQRINWRGQLSQMSGKAHFCIIISFLCSAAKKPVFAYAKSLPQENSHVKWAGMLVGKFEINQSGHYSSHIWPLKESILVQKVE